MPITEQSLTSLNDLICGTLTDYRVAKVLMEVGGENIGDAMSDVLRSSAYFKTVKIIQDFCSYWIKDATLRHKLTQQALELENLQRMYAVWEMAEMIHLAQKAEAGSAD